MTRRIGLGMRAQALLIAMTAITACAAPPSPSIDPVHPLPSASREIQDPSGSPPLADGVWRAVQLAAPDPIAFRVAAAASGTIAGDRTVWARAADGTWIPADAFDENSRWGLVGWRGGFVDWGQVGMIRTSSDGVAWQDARSGPGEANLLMVVSASDQLLLVGQGIQTQAGAWLSADGDTWTAVHDAPSSLWAAAWWPTRGMIVAGRTGADASISLSADGVSWRSADAPSPVNGHAVVSGLAMGPAAVVAIGDIDGRPAAWRTTDLTEWTESPNGWGRDAFLASVVDVDGTFVIAGRRSAGAAIWSSVDGRSWVATDLPFPAGGGAEAAKVVAIDGAIVVFGYTTKDEGNGGSSRVAPLVWTLDITP